MRILYQLISFVNTKTAGDVPELTIQPTQFTSAAPRFTFHLWVVVLIVIGSADFAEAQRNSAGVANVLSSETDGGFARALEPMTFQFPRDHGAHPEYQIEWWYYTGNLRTDNGQAFGLSVDLFPPRTDTSNARADFTFRHKPGLHGAFCRYGCSKQ